MKKIITLLALATLAFVGCQKDDTIHVENVTLDQTEVKMHAGEEFTLVATVTPKNAAKQTVIWASSNVNVATVSNNGKVTAVADGSAEITVTTEDGAKTAKCNVTVAPIEYTAVYTDTFEAYPFRTAFAPDAPWAVFSLNQSAENKASFAAGYIADAPGQTSNLYSVYLSSYWNGACATQTWIVSSPIDLAGYDYAYMTFLESQKYADLSQLTVWACVDEGIQPVGSEEGVWWGGPTGVAPKGTWEQLNVPNHANMTGETYDFIESGEVDLNNFSGEKIRIAFRYEGSTEKAGTWNIDNITVFGGK